MSADSNNAVFVVYDAPHAARADSAIMPNRKADRNTMKNLIHHAFLVGTFTLNACATLPSAPAPAPASGSERGEFAEHPNHPRVPARHGEWRGTVLPQRPVYRLAHPEGNGLLYGRTDKGERAEHPRLPQQCRKPIHTHGCPATSSRGRGTLGLVTTPRIWCGARCLC